MNGLLMGGSRASGLKEISTAAAANLVVASARPIKLAIVYTYEKRPGCR
jgi:hypothetical protein